MLPWTRTVKAIATDTVSPTKCSAQHRLRLAEGHRHDCAGRGARSGGNPGDVVPGENLAPSGEEDEPGGGEPGGGVPGGSGIAAQSAITMSVRSASIGLAGGHECTTSTKPFSR